METYDHLKPKVGDSLFLVDVGNRARNGRGKQRSCTVSKVGRKYFTVEYCAAHYPTEVQLRLDTWRENSNYTPGYQAYPSEQQWLDEQERLRWLTLFRESFSSIRGAGTTKTLQQLRDAAEVLELTLPEEIKP
jgi:hypothetical protein